MVTERSTVARSRLAGDWNGEYLALLKRLQSSAEPCPASARTERREHPRFQLLAGTIGVQLHAEFPVFNVSASGVCFRSLFEVREGRPLNLVLGGAFVVEVIVIACESTLDEPDHAAWPWRIHSRFARPGDGVRLVVMLDAMGELEPLPPAG